MLQPRIQNFFHPPKFCSPQVTHVVEAFIDGIEPGAEEGNDETEKRGVKQHRNANGKIELLSGHQRTSAPTDPILSRPRPPTAPASYNGFTAHEEAVLCCRTLRFVALALRPVLSAVRKEGTGQEQRQPTGC